LPLSVSKPLLYNCFQEPKGEVITLSKAETI